ncbi:hypothetical protein IR083_07120 [Dysgonomonas sp. GY75]|uniref:hypothetical protein n=1 Tax=Dysgonomonas sp. GY75 TaxID=2780419 RepID=UPI001883FFDE|nr:hypothetical protein [Dysgonomonas sp. GY75]MBF0648585.1 hypothetical protein [Dysgonomonas sp. GY75]
MIIYANGERIAVHVRDRWQNKYTTAKEHLPKKHQNYMSWDNEYFIRRGYLQHKDIGVFIENFLKRYNYSQQAYKQCSGILSLAGKEEAGLDRLVKACRICIENGLYNYSSIKRILMNKLDLNYEEYCLSFETDTTSVSHSNLMGAVYYKSLSKSA